jgi:cytochrome c oxidase subunit IV
MESMAQATAAAPDVEQVHPCPNCGNQITGQFCSACGEQRFHREHFAFSHFFHHVLHEFIHLDSKIFRTLRSLFTQPGQITEDYLHGRKSRYVNPIRLYLVSFAVLFFFYSVGPMYDIGQLSKLTNQTMLLRLLETKAKQKGVPVSVLADHLSERWQFYLHLLQPLNVVVMAAVLALVYRRQKRYFAEHLITALYFLSFTALLDIIKWPVFAVSGWQMQGWHARIQSLAFLMIALPYLWLSLCRVYKEAKGTTAWKTVITYGGTQLTIIVTTGLSLVLALVHVLGFSH